MSDKRLPPHSDEMEQCVLGSVLLDARRMDDVADILAPADFYRAANGAIFAAMRQLNGKGGAVDYATLVDEMDRRQQLESVGGAGYLLQLVGSVATGANIAHYAGRVAAYARLRRLADQGRSLYDAAMGAAPEEADAVASAAGAALAEAVAGRGAAHEADGPAIVGAWADRIDAGVPPYSVKLPRVFGTVVRGLSPGELTVIGARSSMGKTAAAVQIAQYAAVTEGVRTLFLSLEMPVEQIASRLLASMARLPFRKVHNGWLSRDEYEMIGRHTGELAQAPLIVDTPPSVTATSVRSRARRLHSRTALGLVVVDYLQMVRADRPTGSLNQDVGATVQSMKEMARELGCAVIVLSQLSRAVEQRLSKRPQLSDLRDSGSIEAEADLVLLLYRDAYYQPGSVAGVQDAEIIVAKHRNGPTGRIECCFDPESMTFEPGQEGQR